jgi:RNA polymerase sigma-70 factor (ECF subfamily)
MVTDIALVEKIKSNNSPEAFRALYERHHAKIFAWCKSILKDPAIAEDATQDTFLAAYCKIDSFRGDAQFSTWLHRIATHAAITYQRKAIHRSELSLETMGNMSKQAMDLAERIGKRDASLEHCREWKEIAAAFKQLRPKYQEILHLRYILGYRYVEIATMLGCTIPCIKSRRRMGIIYLQQILLRKKDRRRA